MNEEIKKEIQIIADSFYQNKNMDGIKKMPELIRQLADYLNKMSMEKKQGFSTSVMNLAEAYERKEYVLVADILSYEIADML